MEHTKILDINDVGIAEALSRWQLAVPLNQRSYRWEPDGEVETLLDDLNKAFDRSDPVYFLGTVVLTQGARGNYEVADGQQRLATTSILIAALRDYLIELGDEDGARQYESEFLIRYDPPTQTHKAKLRLNIEDNEYFFQSILLPPARRGGPIPKKFESNSRLEGARSVIGDFVRRITATSFRDADKPQRIYQWLSFLKEQAIVVAIIVPSHISNSFRMFETLNARGAPASQVDILKNFLFDKAPSESERVSSHWTSMLSIIEGIGEDDLVLDFIRHYWISIYGPTTAKELGDSFEAKIRNDRHVLEFVSRLDASAVDYRALLLPMESPRWAGLSTSAKKAIQIISNEAKAEQIRPLMLAVARCFEAKEAEKSYMLFLSWVVRFLIVGGGGGGKLSKYYGNCAMNASNGDINNAASLKAFMTDVIHGDRAFEEAFAVAQVTKDNLARYYLRAFEAYAASDPYPQLLINEDTNAVNLEHVLPLNPSPRWKIDPDTAKGYHKRLGNMALLKASDNVSIGNGEYAEKIAALEASPFEWTKEIPKRYREWGVDQIRERQRRMAGLAPKVWPL